jgi:GNAT superfamily N-acetyltransferase
VDANPIGFLEHLGSAPSVGISSDPDGARLTCAAPVPLFRSEFRLRCADDRALRRRIQRRGGMWWLGPSTRPPDAGRLLAEAGVPEVEAMPLMDVNLDALPAQPAGVEVIEVRTPEQLAGWASAHAVANGQDAETERLWLTVMSELGIGSLRHFIAVLDDAPVASASTLTGGGTIGLYNVGTVPAVRGRGIGTAITLAALAAARRDGHRTAMLGAEPPAVPLYRRLGFRDRAVMRVHLG